MRFQIIALLIISSSFAQAEVYKDTVFYSAAKGINNDERVLEVAKEAVLSSCAVQYSKRFCSKNLNYKIVYFYTGPYLTQFNKSVTGYSYAIEGRLQNKPYLKNVVIEDKIVFKPDCDSIKRGIYSSDTTDDGKLHTFSYSVNLERSYKLASIRDGELVIEGKWFELTSATPRLKSNGQILEGSQWTIPVFKRRDDFYKVKADATLDLSNSNDRQKICEMAKLESVKDDFYARNGGLRYYNENLENGIYTSLVGPVYNVTYFSYEIKQWVVKPFYFEDGNEIIKKLATAIEVH